MPRGRPRKYATPEEARQAVLKRKREEYRDLKGGEVRKYTRRKLDDPLRGSFWAYKVSALKTKCTKGDIPFDLTPEHLKEIWTETCPVLGFKMEVGAGDRAPSVDRFDPTKGYTQGNVRWISKRANTLKGDATLEEVEKLLTWMKGVTNGINNTKSDIK